ncbi:MAG: phosphoglycerate kinase [Gammaproteobacteria bacterium]|nr:phosphoglycerate kinase [Gammaproteobacteria bacterium]
MNVIDFNSLDISGKRVLIREDFNVPISDGKVTHDARLRAAWPAIEYALEQGAKVMVMSHLGRPEEGKPISEQPEASLAPVRDYLEGMTGKRVALVEDYLDGFDWPEADVVLLENVRVNDGEGDNDADLAKQYAALCDVFVMDAFGTAHRAQASTEGVARYAPVACAGPLLIAELGALERALANPKKPIVAIVAGSKVSTKLEVLEKLANKVNILIVGGGIANTFLAAIGKNVGASLYEADMVDTCKRLMEQVSIPMPSDVVVGKSLDDPHGEHKSADNVADDEMILDIGPGTAHNLQGILEEAQTIIWNGPVGVFENDAFAMGTRTMADAIGRSSAFSIAGGGDTLAAIDKFGIADKVSYISTGGGAFLEFIEGKTLPAVAALEARAKEAG